MERITTFSVAVTLAIAGFFGGLFLAASLGLHEARHVFPPAIGAAAVGAVLSVVALPAAYRRLSINGRRFLTVAGGIALVSSFAFFWRTVA